MNPQSDNQQTNKGFIHPSQIIKGSLTPSMLASTPTQAKGDLYYSDGTRFIRLPIGTVGQTLKVVNGAPAWVT
jgi:hypothetical protein